MSTQTSQRDTSAVLALVLAVVLPPVGLLLALYGPASRGERSGLRFAAMVVGVIGTVLGTLLLVWGLGIASTQE